MIRRNALGFSEFIGIPYREPHDRESEGLHCWELVEKAMRELFRVEPPGIEFSGTYDQSAPVFMNRLRYWRHIDFSERRAGDLIVLRIAGDPCHCGILVNQTDMLHTMKGHNSCVESVIGSRWESRIYGVYRWLG